VARYSHAEGSVSREDAQDVIATVHLRLIARLRSEEPIESVDDYVATLTYNTLSDLLRRRYPQRTRLRNRLRYVLTHDPRLAIWPGRSGLVAGLKQREGASEPASTPEVKTTRAMLNASKPADAVFEMLLAGGGVMSFDALVELAATLWQIVDAPPVAVEDVERAAPESERDLTALLRELWREIGSLPVTQRQALLLNLRHGETQNVIELFAFTATASFRELAAALELTADQLAAIWNELPLPDNRIAAMLGVSRQQVINLRKSARKRLARRVLERRTDR
jgi:RNA polymerase sigma factor (sigma-70 family)